jgi:LmbE family N-acetylglucosaminyl deacetylase
MYVTAIGPAAQLAPAVQSASAPDRFPQLRDMRVLAVTARPGQESAELGGLLSAFRRSGCSIGLLCLTRGEASQLNSTRERLETIRPWELQVACDIVGVTSVMLSDFPNGALNRSPMSALIERVERAIRRHGPDLLLVTDPVDGSPDDARLAQATCLAARRAGLPVAARTMPGAVNSWALDLGAATSAVRAVQRSAAAAHASQLDGSGQEHDRLEALDGREWLRWLVPPVTGTMSWLGSAWRAPSVSISQLVPRPRNAS